MGETISTLVFRPPNPTYLRPSRYFLINTDDDGNQIPAFFIKRRGARLTLLFSHGNAEDLGMMYNRMKEMARVLCVNIMAYDYTGYGKSTGKPCEKKCYENIEVIYRYLVDIRNIPPEQIVLYGRSLGSGPACYLAAKTANEGRSIAGVILHSPFLSIFRVVVDCGFTMVGDMFRNIDRVSQICCPVLLIHGTQDEVVPFWHSQELLNALPPACRVKPFFVDGMGHNNIEVYQKHMYIARVTDFLCRYVPVTKDGKIPLCPIIVPVSERGSIEIRKSSKSRLNPAWICHGAAIVKQAINCERIDTEEPHLASKQRNKKSNRKNDIYSVNKIYQNIALNSAKECRNDQSSSHRSDNEESRYSPNNRFSPSSASAEL